jgi:hypothetical protein
MAAGALTTYLFASRYVLFGIASLQGDGYNLLRRPVSFAPLFPSEGVTQCGESEV